MYLRYATKRVRIIGQPCPGILAHPRKRYDLHHILSGWHPILDQRLEFPSASVPAFVNAADAIARLVAPQKTAQDLAPNPGTRLAALHQRVLARIQGPRN